MRSEDDLLPSQPRTRTVTSVVMLLVAATVFSFLACFAIPQALVNADLMSPWPPEQDPRPLWMLKTFFGLLGGFVFLGAWFRCLSWRQIRRMDAMAE